MTFIELSLAAAVQPLVLICALCAALLINNHPFRILFIAVASFLLPLISNTLVMGWLPLFMGTLVSSYGIYLIRFLLSPPGSTPGRKKKKAYKMRRYA